MSLPPNPQGLLKLALHTAILCLGAAAGNYLNIPLMFGVDFIFGSIFAVYALLTLGLLPAFFVALAGGTYTLILWGHPYALIIFSTEIIVLGGLLRLGYKNTVMLDLAYWCFLGIPMVMGFYAGTMAMEPSSAGMIALKQTLNGIFNALCAQLLVLLQLSRQKKYTAIKLNFEQLIFYPLLSTILLIGCSPIIWDGLRLRSNLEQQLESRLHDQLTIQSNTLLESTPQTIPLTGLGDVTLYKINNKQSDHKHLPNIDSYESKTSTNHQLTIFLPRAKMSVMQRWHQGIYLYQLPAESPSSTHSLIATVPSTALIDTIEKERSKDFLLLSALLLLSLCISKALSHWLASPLRSMMLLSYSIEKKVGTHESIDYPKSNISEYQRLSDSLQRMSENLSKNFKKEQQYHQKLETLVKERTAELSLVIDNTNVGIWDWHVQTGEVTFNERWAEIIGYTLEELSPLNIDTWTSRCHPDDLATSTKQLQEYWQGKHSRYECEARMRHKKGHWVWVLDSGRTIEHDQDGQPVRMVGTHLDISASKQAEAEMDKLSRIASQTSNAVVVTNIAGEIDWVNDSFTRISGYNIDDVKGRTPGSFLQGENTNQDTVARMSNALKQHQSFHEEVLNYHRNGKAYWIEVHCNPLTNKNGEITGFIAIQSDITQQKETSLALVQAKEKAETAAKVKSEFLASMSHEIRTPMNGVIGMLNLLMRDPLSEEQLRRAQMANSSAHALLNLINDILDFSKVDAGKLELESLDFNLVDELSELIKSMAIRTQEKDIELILDTVNIEHSMVRSDPNRIRQILTNLIGNAIKFTDKGEIAIHCALKPSADQQLTLNIQVVDTGIGIPNEKIASLFDSFTQVDASTTRQYGGTGLGLTIAKRLCELLGGSIEAHSEEGRGSRFEITLTLHCSALPQPTNPEHKKSNFKALIIDDNALNAQTLQKQLQHWGIQTAIAHSAESAINQCKASSGAPYRVIFIDRKMPEKSGVEIGADIIALPHHAKAALILMKEMTDDIDAKTLAQQGFKVAYPKPITAPDLLAALKLTTSPPLSHPTENTGNATKNNTEDHASWPKDTRVLLVEDNAINQEVATGMLADLGLNCDIANHGQEAINILKANKGPQYSLILMDCQMPIMDGYETSRLIRLGHAEPQHRDTIIIAMTANAMKGDKEKCLNAGMNEHIPKPIDSQVLEKHLNHWLLNSSTAVTSNPSTDITNHTTIWDESALLSRVKHNRSRALKLIDMFLAFLPERIERLKASQQENNHQRLQEIAHAIKGVSGNLGALKCVHCAEALERRAQSMLEAKNETQALLNALDETESILIDYTAKPDS